VWVVLKKDAVIFDYFRESIATVYFSIYFAKGNVTLVKLTTEVQKSLLIMILIV